MTGRLNSAPLAELERFLDAHPKMAFAEIVFTGMNGVSRGKRLRRHELAALYEQGRFLPTSTLVSDITGRDVEATGLVWETGDADMVAWPIPGTLTPAPWLGDDTAQVAVMLHELNGEVSELDPRRVLQRVVEQFAADGLTPVVACELEFYLVDGKRRADGGLVPAAHPITGERSLGHNPYGLRELEDAGPFLRELWASADAQQIPLEGAISEYAPGQLELTLRHRDDAVRACDDAVLYKRIAKGVAAKQATEATFMAKPFPGLAGSGLHIHVSVLDAKGRNMFAAPLQTPNKKLLHAIGGLQQTMAAAMAIFAPNANSWRRFVSESYAPISASWGLNNRTVSLRVPAGSDASRHVEHRISGADANPYLAVAAVLAGILEGLRKQIDPGPPVEGNGYVANNAHTLPADWLEAIKRFENDGTMHAHLGERFVRMYATVKHAERSRFNEVVTALDYDWYLRSA